MRINQRGFSLLEVIIALVMFSSFAASVFYFFSGAINSHGKLKQKYTQLRVMREFVDNFESREKEDVVEKEGYVLAWKAYELEKKRRMQGKQPLRNYLQLKLIHVDMRKKGKKDILTSFDFVINEFVTSGKPSKRRGMDDKREKTK